MMLSQKNPIHIENPVVFYCNMMRFEKLHTAFFFFPFETLSFNV